MEILSESGIQDSTQHLNTKKNIDVNNNVKNASIKNTNNATTTVDKGIDDYERDTDVSEELSSAKLMELLLPDGSFPGSNSNKSNFFIAYSNNALSAWVKQRSPGCAAASVAGAWNALGGLKRQDKGARTMDDNINVLIQIQKDRVNNTRGRIERLLGNLNIEPVLDAVKKVLKEKHDGKFIGGENKATSASKKLMKDTFKKVVFESFQLEGDDEKTYVYADPVFQILREDMEDPEEVKRRKQEKVEARKQQEALLAEQIMEGGNPFETKSNIGQDPDFTIQPFQSSTNSNTNGNSMAKITSASENELNNDSDAIPRRTEEDEEQPIIVETTVKVKTKKISWVKEFSELFNRMGGLRKLERKRPSTAAFGNWGITSQVNWISSESLGLMDLRCSMFMGKRVRGSKLRCPLSTMDKEEDIYMQWLQLRAMFTRDDTILLSHHKNHYALIYAIREWTETVSVENEQQQQETSKEGEENAMTNVPIPPTTKVHVRQVLTARKGQRPSAWIDWKELRSTYIGWAGYKLMTIQRSSKQPSKAEWEQYVNDVLNKHDVQEEKEVVEADATSSTNTTSIVNDDDDAMKENNDQQQFQHK